MDLLKSRPWLGKVMMAGVAVAVVCIVAAEWKDPAPKAATPVGGVVEPGCFTVSFQDTRGDHTKVKARKVVRESDQRVTLTDIMRYNQVTRRGPVEITSPSIVITSDDDCN